MPYIGKHLSVIDACEIILNLLDQELDLSNVEIPIETEKKEITERKLTRREKVRISKRITQKIKLDIPEFHMSELLNGMYPMRNLFSEVGDIA